MVWSAVGTPLLLKTDWQYTEPVVGSYFKLRHSSFPTNNSYLVAQAQVNLDGSVELADIQELRASDQADVLQLTPPPVFTNRRIAIKRLPKQISLGSEFRRIIRNDLLVDADIEPTGRRSAWSVGIEASDYVEPVQSSGGGSTPSATTTKTLAYVSDGDTNGVCYWLGTNYGTEAWTNPHIAGRLTVSASSTYPSFSGSIVGIVDRADSDFFTENLVDQRIIISLLAKDRLIPNGYSLKSGQEDFLRNWKFQVKNEEATWTDLDVQSNNTTLVAANQWLSIPVSGITTGYRYLSILQTGINASGRNIERLGELEFYGTLTTTT